MKIIGGELKGRRIAMPRGVDIRPTSDKVRESLFNIIRERVEGAAVLDLFAGSGSLGLEALSRGALNAVFVDIQKKCADAVRRNCRDLAIPGERFKAYHSDAFASLKKLDDSNIRFDLVFLDPPYYINMVKKALISICNHDILNPSSLVISEHFKKDLVPDEEGGLKKVKEAKYGDTVLSFYMLKTGSTI